MARNDPQQRRPAPKVLARTNCVIHHARDGESHHSDGNTGVADRARLTLDEEAVIDADHPDTVRRSQV